MTGQNLCNPDSCKINHNSLIVYLNTNSNKFSNNWVESSKQKIWQLKVKQLSDKAIIPTRGSPGSAGYNLSSTELVIVPAHGKALVSTQLAITLPEGTYGQITSRSGLVVRNMLDVRAGVIDRDYQGEVKVLLFNHSDTNFKIRPESWIAQLVIEKIEELEIEVVDELEKTE